ncbi:polycomb protein Su(z)12, partial [Condylostylus longicornis]|uniref:polycomb protein Su(z)12 n=1 Tax=Condylostylus longicornis TaxID=2530218 RepID=UPI00244DB31B
MAPKKREKEPESSTSRMVLFDNELFLQAFEKPTQIYRYIANRHAINPLYLNRNLTYMKHRMSRTNQRRSTFKIESLLDLKLNKMRMEKANVFGDSITLKFLGFYDNEEEWKKNDIVRVEIFLLKISRKKRKDFSSDIDQIPMGMVDVCVNPNEDENLTENRNLEINIPTESFMPLNNNNQNVSYGIFFKVETLKLATELDENQDDRNTKRLKPNTKFFGADLSIFDKQNRCILASGKYDLALHEIRYASKSSPKKYINWETIPSEFSILSDPSFDIFKQPTLQFYMSWSSNHEQKVEKSHINGYCDHDESKIIRNHNNNSIATVQNANTLAGGIVETSDSVTSPAAGLNGELKESNSGESVQIYYNFMYNNNSRQQSDYASTADCPWCRIKCRKLYALLKHLKLCHPRFNFTYVPINNTARIDVTINDMYDGSNAGSPYNVPGPSENSYQTNTRRRTVVTNLLVCRPRRQKANLSEFLELDENEINNQRSYITGHNRLYHHAETCLPIQPQELEYDSEGESDPLWLRQKTMQMIDEFSDVNEGEKELMKMWNLHVMRHGYVGDCQLSIACDMFLESKGKEIIRKNLFRNFLLHLTSLFDYGLISPECVHKCIQKLQSMLSTDKEGRQILSESHERQLDYWLKEGCFKEQKEKRSSIKLESKGLSSLTNIIT